MFLSRAEIAHDNARRAVLAFEPGEKVLEQSGGDDQPALTMGNEFAPVFQSRRVFGRGDDFEILGAVGIGPDIEEVAMVHHFIAQARLARGDQTRRRGRRIEVDDMRLGGVVAMHRDDRRGAAARRVDADEPGGVGFLIDLDIVACRRSDPVQQHPAGPMILIEADVKKAQRIARPDDMAGAIADGVVEVDRRCRYPGHES